MIKELSNGLLVQVGSDGMEKLIIDSSRLDECIRFVLEGHIKYISINSYKGYADDNIVFLNRLAGVLEGLHLPESKFDISIVNSLHKLQFLGIADNGIDTVELSNFPDLKDLACEHSSRLRGLGSCTKLQSLTLTNYKPSNKDLTMLPKLEMLQELSLFVTNITTLGGIEKYRNLEKLSLFRAVKLETIEALNYDDQLKDLEIENCKYIRDYEVLKNNINLGRLKILNSGTIKSLSFVQALTKLTFLSFQDTVVEDGDISILDDIGYKGFVGFNDKKHYSLRMKHFELQNNVWRSKRGT
jgi:hypothetical protein